jgi:hypothetical protein
VSIDWLGRRIGGMPRWPLVGHVPRLVPATVGALAAYALTTVLDRPRLTGRMAGDLVAPAAGGTAGLCCTALGYR